VRGLIPALRETTALPLSEADVIVHRNVGSRMGGATSREDHMSWRGFNLLLLDPRGQPRFYAKCRPGHSQRAAREREAHLALARDGGTAQWVPPARVVQAGGISVLLLDYVEGQTLGTTLEGLAWPNVRESIEDVLQAVGLLLEKAGAATRSDDVEAGRTAYACRGGVREWFGVDKPAPALDEEMERCLGLLEGVPPVAQHGDLTVDNILAVGGRPVFLDFETLGEFDIPLRDAWSIARSLSPALRPGEEARWWKGPQVQWVLEQAHKSGMTAEQAWAVLPVYLADYAGTLLLRGTPAQFAAAYLAEAEHVLKERLLTPCAFR
jgi:hypothetical protein